MSAKEQFERVQRPVRVPAQVLEDLAKRIWDKPKRYGQTVRFGRRGSKRINLQSGTYCDFEESGAGERRYKSGDALSLILDYNINGISKLPDALKLLQDMGAGLQIETEESKRARQEKQRLQDQERRAHQLEECRAKLKSLSTLDPDGPPWLYLDRVRCISPWAIHEAAKNKAIAQCEEHGFPALATIGRNAAGAITAIQTMRVLQNGRGRPQWGLKRQTTGIQTDASVRLAPVGEILAIAEGCETALAFASIFRIPTWATLGKANLANFVPPPGVREIVIAADGDKPGMEAAQIAFENLSKKYRVRIAPACEGSDWADELAADSAGAPDDF